MKKLLFLLYFIPIITFGQTIQNITPFFGANIPYHNPADSIYVSWANKPDGASALYTAQYLRNNFLQWLDSTRYITPYYLTHANISFKGVPNFQNGINLGGDISLGTNSINSTSGNRTWGINVSAGMTLGDVANDHYVVINTSPTTGYVGIQNGANTISTYLQQTGVQFKTGNYDYALNLTTNELTANQIIAMPDSSGTIALTSNFNNYLNKSNNLSDLSNTSTARSNVGLPYGTLNGLNNQLIMRAFGPSITEGGQGGGISWPAQLSTLSGYIVNNYGIGGQTSTQILARLQADNAAGNTNYATIIDNFSINSWQNVSTEETNYSAALASLGSNTRYLFTSIIRGSSALVQNGTTGAANITTLNTYAASIAPGHYVDLMPALIAAAAHTHQDSLDAAAGIVPTSLRVDSIHLTTAGYAIIANTIYAAISMLQDKVTVVTNTNMGGLFANKPLIDATRGFTINGRYNLLIPNQTPFIGTAYIASSNNSGTQTDPSYNLVHTTGLTGQYNLMGGFQTGVNLSSAYQNVMWGPFALSAATTAFQNEGGGYGVLNADIDGGLMTVHGFGAVQYGAHPANGAVYGAYSAPQYTGNAGLATYGNYSVGNGTTVAGAYFGDHAAFKLIDGTQNDVSGSNAMYNGLHNIGVSIHGYNAGYNITSNNDNINGNGAAYNATTATRLTVDGPGALNGDIDGSDISSFGTYNLLNLQHGNATTSMGSYAGYGLGYYTMNGGVLLGYGTGRRIKSGSTKTNSILIGYNTYSTTDFGATNVVAIGNALTPQDTTASNTLNIMNGVFGTGLTGSGTTISPGKLGIFVPTPTSSLDLPPSNTTQASLRVLPGIAPTSPNWGDVWHTSNRLHFYANNTDNSLAYVSDIGTTVRGYGQVTLSSGQATISISGVTTSSRAHISFVSIGGSVSTTWQYAGVCTSGTLTITALTNTGGTNTSDNSVLTYYVEN